MSDKKLNLTRAQLDALTEARKSGTWNRLLDAVAAKMRARQAAKRDQLRAAAHQRVNARADEALYAKVAGTDPAPRPTSTRSVQPTPTKPITTSDDEALYRRIAAATEPEGA